MITTKDLRNFPSMKRLLNSCSQDQTRYHLNGVYLEQDSDKTLVSTDGHRLFTCTSASVLPLLPSNMTAGLIYSASALKAGGINVIEGRYPNWRQLLPSKDRMSKIGVYIPKWFSRFKAGDCAMLGLTKSGHWTTERGALAYFNAAYLADFADESLEMQIRDELSPCLIESADWKYVVMPMRGPK